MRYLQLQFVPFFRSLATIHGILNYFQNDLILVQLGLIPNPALAILMLIFPRGSNQHLFPRGSNLNPFWIGICLRVGEKQV